MRYYDIVRKLSKTPIADVPGASEVHSLINRMLWWKHQLSSGPSWIEYDGRRIYVDTSDYVGAQLSVRGIYEPQVHKKIDTHLDRGDFAIDIGAHVGHHTVSMRKRVETEGMVYAFEPNPDNLFYIEQTVGENDWDNIELFPIALSDTESSQQLVVSNSGNTGGANLSGINTDTHSNPDNEYTVEVKKLSSILNKCERKNVDLLKIDVEGAEVNIIKDLSGLLCHIEIMLIEFHTPSIRSEYIQDCFEILNDTGKVVDLDDNVIKLDDLLEEKKTIIWQSH